MIHICKGFNQVDSTFKSAIVTVPGPFSSKVYDVHIWMLVYPVDYNLT